MMQERITPQPGDALILVDVQNDFVTGSLAVPGAPEIIPVLNRYIRIFESAGLPVFATRDWHTPDHCSFEAQGGPWPPHCVAQTDGAEFAPALALPEEAEIISKGTTTEKDAYSGFEDTDLAKRLRDRGIKRVYIGGLATDYCVLNTVRDALGEDFEVYLLEDAIRAVNVQPGDGEKAEAEMKRLGARPLELKRLAA